MNIKEAILKNKNKAIWIDSVNFPQESILNTAAEALNKGYKIIQFYFKFATDKQNIELGFKLRQLCSIFDALLIVNSRADIAQIIEADGLCLFQNDITLTQARKLFHNDSIFAIYSVTLENVLEAYEAQPDYICIEQSNLISLNDDIKALNKIKLIELNREFL